MINRTLTLLLCPVLIAQGLWVRLRTLRLPDASGSPSGFASAEGDHLHLLVLGESTVAGVGAPTHELALTGQTASALVRRTGRGVYWHAFGLSGITARGALRALVPQMAGKRADAVVIALGVNDVTRGRRVSQWTKDIKDLIAGVRQQVGNSPVILAGVPPLQHFPALPRPLRTILGMRAGRLDRACNRIARELNEVIHVPLHPRIEEEYFSADGFHPSQQGYAMWGEQLAEVIASDCA